MMENPSKRTRRSVLLAVSVILAIAVIWLIVLESRSYTRALCRRINEFGYSVSPSDLYTEGYGADTAIKQVLERKLAPEEIEKISELSVRCGFTADIESRGTVELVLWKMDTDKVMIAYLLDRTPQLVFIEDTSSGEAYSIDKGRE